ncbi:hypothetical protein [uncultured Varibaculum sp.]|uniref:hypothetical protein n=1 Tax=uncultured Varibaculum sp. TaxID=413896 RepID=UPI0027D99D99|nr:hypothetical protein [uncultured Varibaculum sp.]
MTEAIKNQIDFDVRAFAEMLTELPARTPIASCFEDADPQKDGHWWASQREHMIFFFMDRLYPEVHYRKNLAPRKVNLSARKAYNLIHHAEALVWIAEALHVLPDDKLESLCCDALKIDRIKRPKFFRDGELGWDVVAHHARHRPELLGREQASSVLKESSDKINCSKLLLVSHHQ